VSAFSLNFDNEVAFSLTNQWKDTFDRSCEASAPGKRFEQTKEYEDSPDNLKCTKHDEHAKMEVERERIVLSVRPVHPKETCHNEFAREMAPPGIKKSTHT
jgi:hypothetical protein